MVGQIMTRRTASVLSTGTLPTLRTSSPGLLLAHRAIRFASTQPVSGPEEIGILNHQREKRPMSPHLAIYQPQLTWILSIANRGTGVALSSLLYAGALSYLFHPLVPAIDSAHLIQLVHDLPVWFKGTLKLPIAVAFTFHTFNGIRHLAWDVGKGLTLKGVYQGGYAVLAATAISSIYLAFFV
ncbi:hypothetical protein BCR39DRAFT_521603 [Naematelia encephala]|uniref:Succinate dehydrogenase cytochrome b560 subunit n=1 Tax=Naematelia encephala TaxID=71784 RepID=A0A1Y2BFD3_9TREE|nr:hypothetical protein BCR39DRAFT_521603 [Naematelia encephala]